MRSRDIVQYALILLVLVICSVLALLTIGPFVAALLTGGGASLL